MTDEELKKIKQKLNLIELEMILNCSCSIIAKDFIELLAMYENYLNKNRKEKEKGER